MCYYLYVQIDELINKIKNESSFLSLKTIIENNSYHHSQPVLDHILEVLERARKFCSGDFIENGEARKLFKNFVNQEVDGLKIKDSMLLVALLHDISKGAKYKDEDGEEQVVLKKGTNGNTNGNMHEYISSLLVPELLKNKGLSEEAIDHVCKVVKFHGVFDEKFFKKVSELPIEEVVDRVKLCAESNYIEALFNIYCDCLTAEPFQFALETIKRIFESPSLYSKRSFYF